MCIGQCFFSTSSECFLSMFFPPKVSMRNVQNVFSFLIGQFSCFSHHVNDLIPWGPLVLRCMIDSCPWLHCISQEDQSMLWSCEWWAAALIMQPETLRFGSFSRAIAPLWPKANYPSTGVRGKWNDFSTSELNMVQGIRTIAKLLHYKSGTIHRALYKC